jgi:predicted ATPase
MLTRLSIRNFKTFSQLELDLAPLTVLTGFNSSGKSTVIQALLLAQVASQSDSWVPLNGPYGLNLGEAGDVLHSKAVTNEISFQLTGPNGTEEVLLDVPEGRSAGLLRRSPAPTRGLARDGQIDTYLSAERLGPRDVLEISPKSTEDMDLGERGQYTAYALAEADRRSVLPVLLHPRTEAEGRGVTLGDQTEAWLSSIVKPVRVLATWIPDAGGAIIRFKEPSVEANWTRPANVGFGLSYALPIIVAGLAGRPGSLFLVESPEPISIQPDNPPWEPSLFGSLLLAFRQSSKLTVITLSMASDLQ